MAAPSNERSFLFEGGGKIHPRFTRRVMPITVRCDSRSRPMGEWMSIAIHLLAWIGELFKKANKWLRSPSFKVGQPRPSSSAFAYMRGP